VIPQPDFRELVGDDLAPEEEARLRRVHDLLVEAGPPPELPLPLVRPPAPSSRRGWVAALALAAALAVGAFLGGYFVGGGGKGFEAAHRVPMHGVGATSGASALIDVAEADPSGNYSVQLHVKGLAPLPSHGYYVLYLTLHGKPIATCGIFKTSGKTGTASVRMTFPDDVGEFDGWIVAPAGQAHARQVLLTT
jgi:hypothetical protein